jgi:hypothetical protein
VETSRANRLRPIRGPNAREVGSPNDNAGKVGMLVIDTGVDDRNPDTAAVKIDLGESQILKPPMVTNGCARG